MINYVKTARVFGTNRRTWNFRKSPDFFGAFARVFILDGKIKKKCNHGFLGVIMYFFHGYIFRILYTELFLCNDPIIASSSPVLLYLAQYEEPAQITD